MNEDIIYFISLFPLFTIHKSIQVEQKPHVHSGKQENM